MPPPDAQPPRRAPHERDLGRSPGTASPRRQAPAGRQRPGPSSALAPSPTPLMPVPDHDDQPDDPPHRQPPGERTSSGQPLSDRAGRRQFHRRAHDDALDAGPDADPVAEELVYLSGRVPRALRDELHIRAIHDGRPVVELLRDAIRRYLDERHV